MSRSLDLSCKQPPVLLPYADFGKSAEVLTVPLVFHTVHVATTTLEKLARDFGWRENPDINYGAGGFGTIGSESFLNPMAEEYWGRNQEMWRGHEWHLCMYTMALIQKARSIPTSGVIHEPDGFGGWANLEFHKVVHQNKQDRMKWLKQAMQFAQKEFSEQPRTNLPYWHNEALVHESHQSWMIRHDRAYKHYFPKTPDALPLVWPPCEEGKRRVL